MALTATMAQPLTSAPPAVRAAYLRRVGMLTFAGLLLAGVTGFMSALAVAAVPILQTQVASLVGILGSYFAAHWLARGMVFSDNPATRWMGFVTGAVFQGIAMGWLLLAAIVLSAAQLGNPLLLVGEALGLVMLTAAGMTAYVWVFPQNFNWLGAGLSMLFLPMLGLMGITFVFPMLGMGGMLGGWFGIALSAVFVVVSAGGLLYQLNLVLNKLRSDMHVQGAFLITMGILILFWNVLVLLMNLNRR